MTADKPEIQEITNWDWPEYVYVREGWEERRVPELSLRNLEFLAERFNELVRHINEQSK